MISLDCETTGLDIRHGARPFFVTICDEDGEQVHWEWDVDPRTRTPQIPQEDRFEIASYVASNDLVLQNAKFDIAALNDGIRLGSDWPWDRTDDTLLAGHLLASSQPHDLTSMALQYLGVDIQPLEDALEEACHECRRLCRSQYPSWRIAKEGLPEMPSAKSGKTKKEERCWKYDTWLPRAIAVAQDLPAYDPYWYVLREYANADSVVTIALWKGRGSWHGMEEELKRRDLWEIYLERRKLLRIAYMMESQGVTVSKARLDHLKEEYRDDCDLARFTCLDIAAEQGYDLDMPRGASPNNSLRTFMFDVLKVPKMRGAKSKTAAPTLDKEAMKQYQSSLPPGPALDFVRALLAKRGRDTGLAYMEGYERFWLPLSSIQGFYTLHPSMNCCGTDTLRWSYSNPNLQNVSNKEDAEGHTLKYPYGPATGREWWKFDAKNIELRIPAYAAGEAAMIALFERPDDPPYYGSNHLLNFHTVYPDLWAKMEAEVGFDRVGPECKSRLGDQYRACKAGGFAIQYGGQEATVDRAFGRKGAYRLLSSKFAGLLGKGGLNERCIAFAERHGYIETIPDRTVNPRRGYPLLCTRTEWGKILPTVPLNYHVQGTAMWWMMKAMIRCQAQLDEWNDPVIRGIAGLGTPPRYFLIIQVHDELVFDFPRGTGPEPWRTNLPRARKLQRLMSQGGDDIGIPTPVSCSYHAESWESGVDL